MRTKNEEFDRVIKVVRSCTNKEQLMTAYRYMALYAKVRFSRQDLLKMQFICHKDFRTYVQLGFSGMFSPFYGDWLTGYYAHHRGAIENYFDVVYLKAIADEFLKKMDEIGWIED
jgi:hypothetical protein